MNGSLDWVEVAMVLGKEEGHAFQYLPGESEETVWPGINGVSDHDLVVFHCCHLTELYT